MSPAAKPLPAGGADLVVAAAGDQAEAVRALATRHRLRAVVWTGGGRPRGADLPVCPAVAAALAHGPVSLFCALAPYGQLEADVRLCLDVGLRVVCAGPPTTSRRSGEQLAARAGLAWGGLLAAGPVSRRLAELRQRPAFGRPVYLRWVVGGGQGLARTWWALRDLLGQCAPLLSGPPLELWVLASRRGRGFHAVATAVAPDRAAAQLVVAPAHLPWGGDAMLLGTGGLLTADAEAAITFAGARPQVAAAPALYAELEWVAGALAGTPTPVAVETLEGDLRLLGALRQALRLALPVHLAPAGVA
ncbi:MAG: hypothetical protein ABIL09_03105 [Gemmatimonadota bacterium]